jgi:hypothetical protein
VGFANPAQFGSLFIADGERLDRWIQGSLPLLDNYPRRLSREKADEQKVLKDYRDFMNPVASRENFIKSSAISKIWPDQFRRDSLPYFADRQMVNEAIVPDRMRTTDTMMRLHQIMSNPLLSDYIHLNSKEKSVREKTIARYYNWMAKVLGRN